MKNKINSILFLSVFIWIILFYVILPKQKISKDEKRNLATIPSLTFDSYINGTWSHGVDDFVDDHFPFRNNFISMAETFHSLKGIHINNQEKVFVGKKSFKKEEINKVEERKKMDFRDDFEEAYSARMLIIDGSVYPFGGGSPAMSKNFSAMINEYALKLKGRTRVFSAVAPLSSAFIPVWKYRKYNTQNKETLLAIKNTLTNGAIFCDVFDELDRHANEKMYFSTDHHWNAKGAYYAYVAFCRGAGIKAVERSEMEKRVKYNFLGSLYQLTRDPSVKANPDTLEYYVPRVTTTAIRYNANNYDNNFKSNVFLHTASGGNTYLTFLGGDAPLIKITTSVKNGKRAVVIKNSMGNAFAVYLISHYEEIFVLDFRYSNHNLMQIIEKNKINDLIFALGMYGAMSQKTINLMRNLATNNGTPKEIIPTNTKVPVKTNFIKKEIPKPADSIKIIEASDSLKID